jgi:P27 family predicted phage terminase small subunit
MVLTAAIPTAPATLTEAQRAAWDDAARTLAAAGRADKINEAMLEVYCRAVVRMREAEAHVAEFGAIVPAPRTGNPIENPHLAVAARASATVAKLSAQLGLEGRAPAPTVALGKPMSLQAYGKRRGVSHEAVRKAVEVGRLAASVVMVAGKPKIADPELADREWAAHTRPRVDRPDLGAAGVSGAVVAEGAAAGAVAGGQGEISYNEARRLREIELWREARVRRESGELELAKRRGELVDVAEARAAVIEEYSVVKTRLLGLPARVKQRLPHVAAEDVRVIDELVREALEELAGDGGG